MYICLVHVCKKVDVLRGRSTIIKFLVASGASVDATDIEGVSVVSHWLVGPTFH